MYILFDTVAAIFTSSTRLIKVILIIQIATFVAPLTTGNDDLM